MSRTGLHKYCPALQLKPLAWDRLCQPGSASKDFGPVTCAMLAADDTTVRKGPRPHPPV